MVNITLKVNMNSKLVSYLANNKISFKCSAKTVTTNVDAMEYLIDNHIPFEYNTTNVIVQLEPTVLSNQKHLIPEVKEQNTPKVEVKNQEKPESSENKLEDDINKLLSLELLMNVTNSNVLLPLISKVEKKEEEKPVEEKKEEVNSVTVNIHKLAKFIEKSLEKSKKFTLVCYEDTLTVMYKPVIKMNKNLIVILTVCEDKIKFKYMRKEYSLNYSKPIAELVNEDMNLLMNGFILMLIAGFSLDITPSDWNSFYFFVNCDRQEADMISVEYHNVAYLDNEGLATFKFNERTWKHVETLDNSITVINNIVSNYKL
jgi:hypothetical protein